MANQQHFNDHILVNFDKLSIGDSNEINSLQNEFETNGWCFIQLPDRKEQLGDQLNEIQTTLSTFFNRDQMEKSRYKSSDAFGYSRVGHKEGIKVLIDEHGLGNHHRPLTTDIEQSLQDLSILFNRFTDVLKSVIFKMRIMRKSSTKEIVPLSPLGMLDIVHYFNEKTGPVEQPQVGLNTDEVNCVPHFDPGLFSLSILSTCDGLQLKDLLTNTWIDGPNNSEHDQRYIGVIWLGEAASILTQNGFKSGIHRVVYPRIPHQSRLTIWQEVCTVAQIETSLEQNDKSIVIPENTTIQMINQPNSVPLDIRSGGETFNGFMKRPENERGLSENRSESYQVKNFESNNNRQIVQQRQVNNSNILPAGASVTMANQPNSVPLQILSGGEPVNNFMKRLENERGLSISKSGVEHMQIRYPQKRAEESRPPTKKKRSLFSKLFNW